ncbi:bifunctional Josephin domain/Machado-Joseph disease protein [Babesia duncani]|uniref:ubiquitinyl hydrolase 1 n=1 Tax=Babesia duncani TaxID=323732 RepID=A0AAD9PMM4_9APIC|nr:bifunctional Josephin domain/Machado-Joseph disease protein [Babesia duncani]
MLCFRLVKFKLKNLQGPKVTAGELTEISHVLDSCESALLPGKYTDQVLGFKNVSEGGFFNVTVLQEALLRRGISCNFQNVNMLTLEAFKRNRVGWIFNVREHWFCARQIQGKWYLLDSLRQSPFEIESENLYNRARDILTLQEGMVFIITCMDANQDLPLAEPLVYSKLDQYQHYLSPKDIPRIEGFGDFQQEEQPRSFLYKAGQGSTSKSQWPTTGGRILSSGSGNAGSSFGAESVVPLVTCDVGGGSKCNGRTNKISIAVKTSSGGRLTGSFVRDQTVKDLFDWLEEAARGANLDLSSLDFYALVQACTQRKLVKYTTGSIELLVGALAPRDVETETLETIGLESLESFLLDAPSGQ